MGNYHSADGPRNQERMQSLVNVQPHQSPLKANLPRPKEKTELISTPINVNSVK